MTEIQHEHSPRALDRALRASAEKWTNIALIVKVSIFVVGAASIFLSVISTAAPFIVLMLTGASEWCRLKSDGLRDKWEGFHRALDTRDSFGWQVSRAELSDLLTESSRELRRKLLEVDEVYFASVLPLGARRAVENVQESAWWAKHIAKKAGTIYLTATLALIVLSVTVILFGIATVKNFDILSSIGRIATATIMLVFSLDLVDFCLGYFKYHSRAKSIEERAGELLSSEKIETVQAIKLMNDYHLAHAAAPINPDWIYVRMKEDLNTLWTMYRRLESE